MTEDEKRLTVVQYWLEKADEALVSAKSELNANRLTFAFNRAYYACFYAASALLLKQGLKFSKHSGVRAALHQHLIKTGKLSKAFGDTYDWLFDDRQEGDYLPLIRFEREQVEQAITDATEFVAVVRKII